MKLTENLSEDIAELEKVTGKSVSPQVRELIKAMAAVGDRFENLGEKDARSGLEPLTKEAFIEWGRRGLNDPEGKDNSIVNLMYQCYLDGYNAGKATA